MSAAAVRDPESFSLGIIGAGTWGINHVRVGTKLFGPALRCVCDPSPSVAERVRAMAPSLPVVANLDDFFSFDFNAVIIATPAATHRDLALRCIEAGKHILVEKPLSLMAEEAEEISARAHERGVTLMVGHILLYHPAVEKFRQLVMEGSLGKLQYLYSNRLNLGQIRREENILFSFAPHDVALFDYLLGTMPTEVSAWGSVLLQPGIHDVTITHLRYPRNIAAHIHVSWLHPFKEHRLVAIGDRSMLVFEDSRVDSKLVLYRKRVDIVAGQPVKQEDGVENVPYEFREPLEEELRHFEMCVRSGTSPISDGTHAVRVLRVLNQAQASLSRGKMGSTALIHETAVVDPECTIGARTQIWHFSHVSERASIGDDCILGQNVFIGRDVKIGNGCKIQNNVSVYEQVELEDHVFCGPSLVFTNVRNPRAEFPRRDRSTFERTLVKRGATLGANATIVCGITIGRFAFVGAGAVVTRDIPDFALVYGNPARLVGWNCRCGHRLPVQEEGTFNCSHCLRGYHIVGGVLRETGDES